MSEVDLSLGGGLEQVGVLGVTIWNAICVKFRAF